MKLFTTTIGDGPRTAALLHGASMTHDIWRDFGRILVDTYDLRLLLVDQRGHGQSPRSTAYAIEDYIADAVENLPTGLDFLIGQSLGGRVGAEASEALRPKRYIGLDPAFTVTKPYAVLLEHVAPHQARFPTWLLKAMGSPPKTAAPDTLDRIRAAWAKWDPSMMKQLVACRTPGFVPAPPAVPSTIVLASPSFCVSPERAEEFRAFGWDVRVKPGAIHDLHIQDPKGLALLLDDVLRTSDGAPA